MKILGLISAVFANNLINDYERTSTFSCDESDNCRLQFENGPTFLTKADQEGIVKFNIRFALEPTGDLRFKAPRLIFNYGTEEIDVEAEPNSCINGGGWGKEDCLFVSIWSTKDMMVDAVKKPGLVWIHGGAWSGGSGVQDRTNLLKEGVIGMTVQYRLGFLGYSMLEEAEEVHKGNWGSQDQARFFQEQY